MEQTTPFIPILIRPEILSQGVNMGFSHSDKASIAFLIGLKVPV